jgi:hypothetical protein
VEEVRRSSFTFQRPRRVNKAFSDMGVLSKYVQIEPIYLPYSAVTYIYLHPACPGHVKESLIHLNAGLLASRRCVHPENLVTCHHDTGFLGIPLPLSKY